MRVLDIIRSDRVTVSCELFPPKLGKPLRDTERIVSEIARLKPSFISVTCGAGGSTGDHTVEIARCVQQDNGVTALAHVTCVSTPRDADSPHAGAARRKAGVENILALRGDLPADGSRRLRGLCPRQRPDRGDQPLRRLLRGRGLLS